MAYQFHEMEALEGKLDIPGSPYKYGTREEWLNAANVKLQTLFNQHGATIPSNIRISCGFPFGRRGITSLNAIGQAWPASLSTGAVIELFISPVLDDAMRVLDVLAHEDVHAAVGNQHGHGPVFKRLAVAIGLTGHMTATIAGPAFTAWASEALEALGPYPHHKLIVHRLDPNEPKAGPDGPSLPREPSVPGGGGIVYRPQATRMLKVSCPHCEAEGTPYIARMAKAQIDRLGPPVCPKHTIAMVQA